MPISHYKSMETLLLEISRPYLYIVFCPDPKHFIVNFEQNSVKYAEKWGREGGLVENFADQASVTPLG